jgi:FkbM family methyltransferase
MAKFEKEIVINRKLTFDVREETGYDPTITDEIVIREIFDDNVYQIYPDDVRDGIVVDIGANVGIFSIYCSLLGAKEIFAFEPEDDNRTMLIKNMNANHISNINFSSFAVSGKNETFEIYKAQGATKRTEYADKELDVKKQKVKAKAINEILDGMQEIAVMKIDCEGGEYPIFAAITEENLKKIKYITMEFHKSTQEEYGIMLAKLSLTHNVHVFGHFDQGGQLYAKRY